MLKHTRAMISHFTSRQDKRTGIHDVRNARHTRAISAHFRANKQTQPPKTMRNAKAH